MGFFSVIVTLEDTERWEAEGRDDILKWFPKQMFGSDWEHPTTGAIYETCPFLHRKKNSDGMYCRIYETRPFVCRGFDCDTYKKSDTYKGNGGAQ